LDVTYSDKDEKDWEEFIENEKSKNRPDRCNKDERK